MSVVTPYQTRNIGGSYVEEVTDRRRGSKVEFAGYDPAVVKELEQKNRKAVLALNRYGDKVNNGGFLTAYDLDLYRKVMDDYIDSSTLLRRISISSGNSASGDNDEWKATVASLESGYQNIYDVFSKFETEDAYKAALAAQTYDIEAGKKEVEGLTRDWYDYDGVSRLRNEAEQGGDVGVAYTKDMSVKEYEAAVAARIKEIYSAYDAYEKKYGSLDALDKMIQEKERYIQNATRAQEGARLAAVADPESELYDPEFSKYSGYIDRDDSVNDYINGKPVRNKVWEKTYASKGYDRLTDKEIATYNYYYAKGGKKAAEKYLNSIQESLNAQVGQEIAAAIPDVPLLQNIFAFAVGVDQFGSRIDSLASGLIGDGSYKPPSAMQVAGAITRENREDKVWYNFATGEWEDEVFGLSVGKTQHDLFTTTGNMAPSILTSVALGTVNPTLGTVAGNTLMGASAAGSAYQEKINLGYSQGQAMTYGLMIGASESLLQYFLGGIGRLGNNVLSKTVLKNLNMVDSVFAKFAQTVGGKILINATSEAVEEGLQAVIEPYLWQAVSGEEATVDWGEAFYNALLGFFTGGMFEGGTQAINSVGYINTGRQVLDAGTVDPLLQLANEMAGVSSEDAQQAINYLSGKVTGEAAQGKGVGKALRNLSNARNVGELAQVVGESVASTNRSDIKTALMQKGLSRTDADRVAKYLYKASTGGYFSEAETAEIESDQRIADVLRDVVANPSSSVNQRTAKLVTARGINKNTSNDAPATAQSAPEESTLAPGKNVVDGTEDGTESHYEVSVDGKTVDISTGDEIVIKGVESIDEGKMLLKTENGTVDAANVSYASQSEALVYETVASMGVSAEGANTLIKGFSPESGSSASAYANGINEAYQYGRMGARFADISPNGFAVELNEQIRKYAYNLGQMTLATQKTSEYNNTTNTEVVNDGTGEGVHLRGGVQRTDGTSSDGSVRRMGETPGGVQERNQKGRSEGDRSNPAEDEGRVNAEDLGIRSGTGAKNLTVVRSDYSADTKEAASVAAEQGLEAVFFTGDNLRIEHEGKVIEARACIVGKKIYVRADHNNFTATQLTKHELTHDKIDSGVIDTGNVYDLMVMYYGEAKVKDIIQAYAEAYDMGYDTQEAADAVFVEIVCDSEAGMNYFAMEEKAGTPDFMENVHYATQADMNSKDTRGPPADGETHFSRETERFLRNFTGEVRYDEYLYLSNVEVATIRSNIKSRATYLSKTAVDGLVWAHSLNRGYAYTFLCNPDYSVTVTDVLDAENDIAIINRTTERMINYARTGASVRRNSSLNGQQRNGNQPSNNSGGTHAQTSQSQGTKGLVSQPSQSNRQGSVGTGAQNRTNSGTNTPRNTSKIKFSREATDKVYLAAVESGDMDTAQRLVDEAAKKAGDGHAVWIPFYSEQIKSAEPVVYDDSGKIIPLSERFNPEKKDIRFSREQKQEVNPYGQDGKAEDHASFIRRMHEGSRRVKQIGKTVFAYEPARAIDTSGAVSDAARELRRIGIKYFYHNGLEYNQNGITYVDNGALCTIEQQVVGIYAKAFGDGVEFAGHEAFHVWKQSVEWEAYVETLRRNINISSSVYGIQQADIVLKEYFGGNLDALASDEAKAQFLEELYALVSGKIHSGTNEAGLKTMFKDYAAVKAAWEELLQSQEKVKFSREFVQEHMTEKERMLERANRALEHENSKLREDNQYLKELVKIQKTLTSGIKFTKASVEAAARVLKKQGNVKNNANPKELMSLLEDFYGYIAKGDEITWESVMEQAQPVVDWLQENKKESFERDQYAQEVLDHIRGRSFYIDDVQKGEAKYAYGSYRAFLQKLLGTFNISDEANMSLDELWKEMAAEHPYYFPEDITSGDQVTAIVDVVNSLRNAKTLTEDDGYEQEMKKRELLYAVYDSYWNVSTLYSVVDVKQREINRLKVVHKKKLAEVRAEHKEQALKMKKYYQNRMEKLREEYCERAEKKQAAIVERYQESRKTAVAKVRETAEKRDARTKLQKLVLDTVKWISYPSKTDVKCPDILKQPYADFLNGIDLSSKRLANGGDPTKTDLRLTNAMGSLATALDKIMTSQDPFQETDKVLDTGYLDLPANFVQDLRDMTEKVKKMMVDDDFAVNNMSAAEVRQLSKMIRTLNHAIKEVSTLYANLRFAHVEALGDSTMEFMDALGEIEKTGGVKDFVQWDNALPYYAFKRFGKGGESVFEGLMDAQDKLAFLAQDVFDFQEKTWTGEEAKAWSEDTHTIDLPNGNALTLTTADAMSIYCLSRREQGLQHLLGGGTRVMGVQKGSQKVKDSRSVLTIEDIDAINSSLTDRQRAVAEAVQEFMSTVCSEWGNEISMKRFLTKEFTEKFYFPIESNDENLPTKDPVAQQSDLFRLLNISATKPLTPGANNEVIIRNIFDVFTGHASDMARLNAYGMALLDYMKWLNYREKTVNKEGQIKVRGVRKSMEQAYGNAAKSYVLNLIKDVNGRPSDGGDPNILMKWMRSAKTASVGNSIRVASLQITSYPRAALVLSPKSLALGLTKLPQIQKAKKYCGIALWKSFGFYDTNISRSIEDQMKGVTDVKQKLIELSLKGAEWGDAITWGALWNACEYEVARTTKNKVGSEEFYQEVGKKLREVVYRTQVVDSTLTRSQIMRSKRGMAQEATAFMSEPTLSANILMDAGFDFYMEKRRTGSTKKAWEKTGSYICRAVAVYSVGQLTAALVEALWDAWRDDEDEKFGEKYQSAFASNLVLDILPFNKLPVISGVAEAALSVFGLGYFSADSMYSAWLTQTVSAVDAWKKVLSGESSTTVYNALYKSTRAVSSMLGISVSGVMREGVALWNNTAGVYDSTLKIRQYEPSKTDLGNSLYDAIISGNDRQAESIRDEFRERAEDEKEYQSAVKSAVRKALRENDSRIMEAAQAVVDKNPTERARIAREIITEGNFDMADVQAAINAEVDKLRKDAKGK